MEIDISHTFMRTIVEIIIKRIGPMVRQLVYNKKQKYWKKRLNVYEFHLW